MMKRPLLMQVLNYGKSIYQKSVWANKKYLSKYVKIMYNKDGSIKITDDWKNKEHVRIPLNYKSSVIIETKEVKGNYVQTNRTFYDSSARMIKQIHSGPHGNFKRHPYGINGEHKHEYKWNEDSIIGRTTEELSDIKRKENKDIL